MQAILCFGENNPGDIGFRSDILNGFRRILASGSAASREAGAGNAVRPLIECNHGVSEGRFHPSFEEPSAIPLRINA
jgi:hypothetical protein